MAERKTKATPFLASDRDVAPELPKDLEAERSILGAVLLSNDALDAAMKCIRAEDFFLLLHRRIFMAMIALRAPNVVIDNILLLDALNRHEKLDAESTAYISTLADGLPRATNVEHYARIVREKSALRELAFRALAIEQEALAGADDVDVILDRARESLAAIPDADGGDWRKKLHRVDELPDGDSDSLIDRILPEGVIFIGGSSGAGKTWLALSMARALTTRQKFLGVWDVPEAQFVLYLCPEMQSRRFKKRCLRLGIGGERFRCQTIDDGAALDLADPMLLAAIRQLQPVIFLDTSIRFSSAESENSASDNQALARAIFSLLHAGAKAVVCLHHRSKDAGRRAEEMTLENSLRGTGDLGAIADAVYGVRYDQISPGYLKESKKLVRLEVRCVKCRDSSPVDDFRIQLKPFIDERGDFGLLVMDEAESEVDRLVRAIEANPRASNLHLQTVTGIGRNRIKKVAASAGWHFATDCWVRS